MRRIGHSATGLLSACAALGRLNASLSRLTRGVYPVARLGSPVVVSSRHHWKAAPAHGASRLVSACRAGAPSVADFPEGRTFSDIVEIRARQQPDRTFARLVKRDGSREALTYGDLEAQSRAVAGALASRGLVAGDRLLILTPNCLEQVIAMLAAARSSLISVPVNPASVPAELAYLMSLVEPACVVVGSAQIGALDEAGLRERAASVVVVVGEGCDDRPWASRVCVWPALLEASDRAEVVRPTRRDPFKLLLTSGTTGRPKAVVHSHATAPSQRLPSRVALQGPGRGCSSEPLSSFPHKLPRLHDPAGAGHGGKSGYLRRVQRVNILEYRPGGAGHGRVGHPDGHPGS